MRDLIGESYPVSYITHTAQKRKREALDKVKQRRTSRRKAKGGKYDNSGKVRGSD